MDFYVEPSALTGEIAIPPSKSHTMRALVFGMMGKGKTLIDHYLPSPDTNSMIRAIQSFGAGVKVQDDTVIIEGNAGKLSPPDDVIHAGNSGIVLRFIGALAGLCPTYTVITGDHSIRHQRHVSPLLEGLNQLHAIAHSMRLDGKAPLIIKGMMKPGVAKISGEDSQPISALLIAASFLQGTTVLHVENSGEKPWIDMTMVWCERLGIKIEHEHYARYVIHGHAAYEGFHTSIPGDFSSAAFPLAAALITNSEVTLYNLDMTDCQGDKQLIILLQNMGAFIECDPHHRSLSVRRGSKLRGGIIDINDCIDILAILAVIACFAEGQTQIINATIARKKESDRIHAMCTELKKMGADIVEQEDGLIINPSLLHGAELFSHRDQRVAMALTVAALGATSPSRIHDVEWIDKTYPHFLTDFQQLGAKITHESHLVRL